MEPSMVPLVSSALAVTARENIMATANSRDKSFFFMLLLPPCFLPQKQIADLI